MKYKKIFIIFSLLFIRTLFSQELELLPPAETRFSGKLLAFGSELYDVTRRFRGFRYAYTGAVTLDTFYDSNEFVGAIHDLAIFFPAPQRMDFSCLDINNKDQFSMAGLGFSSKILFIGPDLWETKVIGRFEFGLAGLNNRTTGVMNIRNIYIAFLRKNTEIRFGHYFHPLSLTTTYPTTVSPSEGVGFDPVRKAPIIRFTHVIDKFKFILALSKIFVSEAARRAAVPDLFAQVNLRLSKRYTFGIGVNYHAEVPRLQTEEDYKTTSRVEGYAAFIFARIVAMDRFLIKTRLSYFENGAPFGIMGAYAVCQRNEVTDERFYTPMRAVTYWADIILLMGTKFQPAVFIGVAKNIGTRHNIIKSYIDIDEKTGEEEEISLLEIPGVINNADYNFEIAPRLRMRVRNVIFGFEIDYRRALFARSFDDEGWQDYFDSRARVVKGKPGSNLRFFFNMTYSF
ncbi:hypothetical protein ACFLYA_01695 [Candidatus Dependentiae bacterium]